MKLDINKDEVLKQIVGNDLFNIYKGNIKEQTKETRQQNYNAKGLNKNARGASHKELKVTIAYAIWMRSQYYCPVDTGYMKQTSTIKPYNGGFEILYPASYATYVHEIPYYNHDRPTRYKFLEEAAIEIASQYLQDYKYKVSLKINYYPLALYVGCKTNIGEDLWKIRDKEQKMDELPYLQMIMNKYLNDQSLESFGFNKNDEEFLDNYITWWSDWNEKYNREISFEQLVYDWMHRERHKVVSNDPMMKQFAFNSFVNNRLAGE